MKRGNGWVRLYLRKGKERKGKERKGKERKGRDLGNEMYCTVSYNII